MPAVYLKIKRQSSPNEKPYWECFSLEYGEDDTLLLLLDKLEKSPAEGSTPVHHDCNCREEVCGTCTIRINGKPQLSCSTLVRNLPPSSERKPVVLEPLEKFPVIRDLTVDRSSISHSLTRVKNWVEDGELFQKPLRYGQKTQQEMYSYSKCINCGSCYDACPRTAKKEGRYIGPAAIARVVNMNDHPLGKESSSERLLEIMGNDGVSKCGKSMNCERVCPKKVPLVRSVTRANREALGELFR